MSEQDKVRLSVAALVERANASQVMSMVTTLSNIAQTFVSVKSEFREDSQAVGYLHDAEIDLDSCLGKLNELAAYLKSK